MFRSRGLVKELTAAVSSAFALSGDFLEFNFELKV